MVKFRLKNSWGLINSNGGSNYLFIILIVPHKKKHPCRQPSHQSSSVRRRPPPLPPTKNRMVRLSAAAPAMRPSTISTLGAPSASSIAGAGSREGEVDIERNGWGFGFRWKDVNLKT